MTHSQSTPTYVESISISDIRVDRRRREDLGDIAALARNIDEHGLLHPIIIAADNGLIAGERRLRACQHLGHTTILARRWPDLTDVERREIELAENLDRKDLTPAERSRQMVALAETAAAVDQSQFRSPAKRNPEGGRPEEPGSIRRIAERLGLSPATIHNATRHVAAIDNYPELAPLTQTDALKIASKLDVMPEPERVEARAAVLRNDSATLSRLTDRPPVPKGPTPHEYAAKHPSVRFQNDLHELWKRLNGVRDHGGLQAVTASWTPDQRRWLLVEVQRIGEIMAEWQHILEEQAA